GARSHQGLAQRQLREQGVPLRLPGEYAPGRRPHLPRRQAWRRAVLRRDRGLWSSHLRQHRRYPPPPALGSRTATDPAITAPRVLNSRLRRLTSENSVVRQRRPPYNVVDLVVPDVPGKVFAPF